MPTMTMNGVTILPTAKGDFEVRISKDCNRDGVPMVRTTYTFHPTREAAEAWVRANGYSVPPQYTKQES